MVIGIDTDEFLAQGMSAVTLTMYCILRILDPSKDGSVIGTTRLSTFQVGVLRVRSNAITENGCQFALLLPGLACGREHD